MSVTLRKVTDPEPTNKINPATLLHTPPARPSAPAPVTPGPVDHADGYGGTYAPGE